MHGWMPPGNGGAVCWRCWQCGGAHPRGGCGRGARLLRRAEGLQEWGAGHSDVNGVVKCPKMHEAVVDAQVTPNHIAATARAVAAAGAVINRLPSHQMDPPGTHHGPCRHLVRVLRYNISKAWGHGGGVSVEEGIEPLDR